MNKDINETQQLVVKKVLAEMTIAEQIVNSWDSSWWEQCLNAYSTSLSKASAYDTNELEIKYQKQYQLTDVQHPKNKNGEPLRIVTLIDYNGKKHKCEFGRIDWGDMSSHKSTRHFSFNNNGIIEFSKFTKKDKKITPQHPRRISYNTMFNVLSNDFEINITLEQLTNNDSDVIVSNFTNSTQLSIAKNSNEKIINFDNSDFNMEYINQAEKTIIEMVKCIRGELPLIGLINRIDYCMELINKNQNIQIEDNHYKILTLELPKNYKE